MELTILDNSTRQCGPCTECCRRLPIAEGIVSASAKPAGVPCPKLCSNGCSVYKQRPGICAAFHCAWLQEPTWPLDWRPYESGLLCLQEKIDATGSLAAVYELRRGALQSATARQMIDQLFAKNLAVVLIDVDENRHTLVPEPVLAEAEISAPSPPDSAPLGILGIESVGDVNRSRA